jgi:hypothetical protein
VRLALLGPCEGDLWALARAATTALDRLVADQVVYLGTDGALDFVVEEWAQAIGVDAAIDDRLRADPSLLDAEPQVIAEEVERERARLRLGRLRSIAGPGLRALEILNDRVVLLVDDKAVLDEEDLLPATIIVFGKGDATVRRIGSRTFTCPGPSNVQGQGLMLLDEGEGGLGIALTLLDAEGTEKQRDYVETTRAAKLRVHGAV